MNKGRVEAYSRSQEPPSARADRVATVHFGPGIAPVRRTLGGLTRRVNQIAIAMTAESLAEAGLTPLQYGAMGCLNRRDGASVARNSRVSSHTIDLRSLIRSEEDMPCSEISDLSARQPLNLRFSRSSQWKMWARRRHRPIRPTPSHWLCRFPLVGRPTPSRALWPS